MTFQPTNFPPATPNVSGTVTHQTGAPFAYDRERIHALRIGLWENGYTPIAIQSVHAIDPTGGTGKKPFSSDWQKEHAQERPWACFPPSSDHALNTGILCRALRVVDIDVEDYGRVERIRKWALENLGAAPLRHRMNSARITLVFRAAEGTPGKRTRENSETNEKIEILGAGQQFVVDGWHHSGARISWMFPLGLRSDLVAITEEQVTALLDFAGEVIGADSASNSGTRDDDGTPVDPADIAAPSADALISVLDAMPNPSHVTRLQYLDVMFAAAGAREGMELLAGALDPKDALILVAGAGWAARWDAPAGKSAPAFADEHDKWLKDFARPNPKRKFGWGRLLGFAREFGTDPALIEPLIADLNARSVERARAKAAAEREVSMDAAVNQFQADPLPPGVNPDATPTPEDRAARAPTTAEKRSASRQAVDEGARDPELITTAVVTRHFERRRGSWHKVTPGTLDTGDNEVRICAEFRAVGRICDAKGADVALLIDFIDAQGRRRTLAIPAAAIQGAPGTLTGLLATAGISCVADSAPQKAVKLLLSNMLELPNLPNIVSVTTGGWHVVGNRVVFVLPDGSVVGDNGALNIVLRQGDAIIRGDDSGAWDTRGSLADWQKQVAAYASGNDRFALFLSAAFAPPLLQITDDASGGLHIHGDSSTGKTAALGMAASVWGSPRSQVRPWRATTNSLEAQATKRCDLLLPLDEMGQAQPDQVADSVYLLFNESSKGRMTQTVQERPASRWRTFTLSTGEVTVAEKIGEMRGAPPAKAGLDARLVNIRADAGAGMGVVQQLHGFKSSHALVDHLEHAGRQFHGIAGRAFLDRLVAERNDDAEALRARIKATRDRFKALVPAKYAMGQVLRVLDRFSLVAAAGELAIEWGILPWTAGEAERAAWSLFQGWTEGRGGMGNREDMDILQRVRLFIEAHGASRFAEMRDGTTEAEAKAGIQTYAEPDRLVINRAGWRRTVMVGKDSLTEYLFLPETWKAEICRGGNPAKAAEVIDKAGYLVPGEGRNWAKRVRMLGFGTLPRFYIVRGNILGADD